MFKSLRGRSDKVFALVLMSGIALGCAGGGEGGGEMAGGEEGGEAMASVVDEATAGTVMGRVTFEGAAPEGIMVDMAEEPTCADKHDGPIYDQRVVVNDNGTLRHVFVYVKEGLGDLNFPAPSESVVLDQDGCRYIPHVFGIQAGQTLLIRNSDGILHNINAKPSVNRGFNISQPVVMDTRRDFKSAEVMVPLECDVHGWMQAYVGVLDHPYHANTGQDGSFSLAPLPPGSYVIEAWHEKYGTMTQEVTVGESEQVEVNFTFSEPSA